MVGRILLLALAWLGIVAAVDIDAQVRMAERIAAPLRPVVVADPSAALPRIRSLRKERASRTNVLVSAKLTHLEAEAQMRLDKPDRAEPLIKQAVAQVSSIAPRSQLMGDLLLSRGSLHMEQVEVAAALADFHAAFTIFQKLGNARAQASTLLNLAILYSNAGDYGSALRYTSQARDIYKGEPLMVLTILNSRALALQELGRTREAERQHLEALAVAQSIESPLLRLQILRNIARLQIDTRRLAQASRTVAAAERLSRQMGTSAELPMLSLEAELLFRLGRLREAEAIIDRGFSGVDLDKTPLSNRMAHETAVEIYSALNSADKALPHLRAVKRLEDEATKLATTNITALMGARFDFANQELKIANLQRDEAQREVAFQRTLALGGASAVTVIIILLTFGLFTIRRSRDHVRAVAADLRVSNDALGKALAAKTEFLASTSHEIRTPLNGILGMTQVMLSDRRLEPSVRDRLGVVHAAGTTMKALVDDILDVAKMETGNLTIEDAPFVARDTLTDAARLWEDQARGKGLTFETDLANAPGRIMGDAARVRQITFNLLSNAVKFTRSGSIVLASRQDGERWLIEVRDTGVGIAPDKLEQVFESFRQADAATTREFGGTGLGLSICRNLAEAMGGTVSVASVEGQGSTFTVTLPCRPAAVADPCTEGGPASLLIVERNPIASAKLRALFASRVEQVAVVADDAEALAWLDTECALAVLADQASVAEPAALATAVTRRGREVPLVLLCPDAASAAAQAGQGWLTVARPVTGTRLIQLTLQTVLTISDTLAARAA
jgi:signal transduction histidine kinase